jgi:hypothetical protein
VKTDEAAKQEEQIGNACVAPIGVHDITAISATGDYGNQGNDGNT